MQIRLDELAKIVGGEISGDASVVITGVAGIREARPGDITFLADPRYSRYLETTKASAIIAARDAAKTSKPVIICDNPYLSFIKVVEYFFPDRDSYPRTIHPSAVVAETARIGEGVAVGACAVIEDGVEIGRNTVVLAGTYIGRRSIIGEDCLIYPNVTIREETRVGNRVIIHSGAVIGSDGFGFVKDGEVYRKIPQVGNVVIEDDVEIGANVTIDRATTGTTCVGRGTKIDNLVQIGHNVVVKDNCIIVAQVGIGGSTEIGAGATIAGQAGVIGHVKIGEGAVIAAQAGVVGDVAPGAMVSGYPARNHKQAKKIYASLPKLPDLLKRVAELAERIAKLERGQKS